MPQGKKKRKSQARCRKQVVGLGRVVGIGVYEKISFVQKLKLMRKDGYLGRERDLGQGDSPRDSQREGLETREGVVCSQNGQTSGVAAEGVRSTGVGEGQTL